MYYFVKDHPEYGHVQAETCTRHIMKNDCFFLNVQLLDYMLYNQSIAQNMENI
jgi:hypothetical protein